MNKPILFFVSLLLISNLSFAKEQNYPQVFLELMPSLDQRICDAKTFAAITPWYTEAYTRLPEFQNEWDKKWAPRLLGSTVKLIGIPFFRKEKTATLMVCPTWIGIGTPLLLPYWPFLKSALTKPIDKTVFYTYLFHEVLHPYVYRLIPFSKQTPLKKKYKEDPLNINGIILAHLHLMAIQKTVLESLGEFHALNKLKETDKFNPSYARAWEIVELEGAEAFLREF